MTDPRPTFRLMEPTESDPDQPHPSEFDCQCPDPDDQYRLEVDAGSVGLVHAACGKPPRGDYTDLIEMQSIPVTVKAEPYGNCNGSEWHGEYRCDCGIVLVVTVNNRAVMHDGVPYLAGRDYADREKALWRITGDEDRDGQPLAFLLPEGAGEPVPLGQVVHDFGPLVLHPEGCTCEQHEDNDSWRRSS